MSDAYEHQRRFPRIPSENPVFVKKLDDENVGAFSKTRQVGLGGCMFTNDEPLGSGSVLMMFISVQGRVIEVKVRVVYEIPKDGKFEVGVEFLEMDPQVKNVIASLLETWPGT